MAGNRISQRAGAYNDREEVAGKPGAEVRREKMAGGFADNGCERKNHCRYSAIGRSGCDRDIWYDDTGRNIAGSQ